MLKILFSIARIEMLILLINILITLAQFIHCLNWYLSQFIYLHWLERFYESIAITAKLLTNHLESTLNKL
ncbi:hypothetical protein [Aerosakkonema sp. BLCC-F183]|uniref:hypothetical protein n=1 Tax=Aerosakkonema sp. BLCC-F183 TaxID=3342834 RepID=UPI0035BC30AD